MLVGPDDKPTVHIIKECPWGMKFEKEREVNNLSELTINVAKDWAGYPIDNLGAPPTASSAVRKVDAETPVGAQAKVDTHAGANVSASVHPNADTHIVAVAPHSGHETPAGAQAKVDAHNIPEQHDISAGLAADRPAAGVAKRYYFSTDTKVWSRDDGTVWVDHATGVSDHGLLTGLADDDHTQYGALAQAEIITGLWTAPVPTAVDGLARRQDLVDDAMYVDTYP